MLDSKRPSPGLRNWILLGISAEVLVLLAAYGLQPGWDEVFRHSARWSGRLSLAMYLLAFHFFAVGQRSRSMEGMERAWRVLVVFAVLHFIHLGFVAMNIHFNAIHLVPARLAGGALAYAMILIYPFVFRRVQEKRVLHLVYFGYVGLVMVITIVARIRGEFEGAEPSLFHSVGLAAVVLVWLIHRRSVLSGKARIHRTWTSEGGPRLND